MAFKTVDAYYEEKYNGKFRLPDDGECAEVVFMYRGLQDEMRVEAHYIKSNTYSGYVHCNGVGCPLCGVKKKDGTPRYGKLDKLFIPLYNITTDKVEFWDRNMTFEPQLRRDVFAKFPNPSELIFRITRHGVANSQDTKYEITPINRNNLKTYDDILVSKGLKMPDCFDMIVKEFTNIELSDMLAHPETENTEFSDYVATPRGFTSSVPDTYVNVASVMNSESVPSPNVVDTAYDVDTDSDDSDLVDPVF